MIFFSPQKPFLLFFTGFPAKQAHCADELLVCIPPCHAFSGYWCSHAFASVMSPPGVLPGYKPLRPQVRCPGRPSQNGICQLDNYSLPAKFENSTSTQYPPPLRFGNDLLALPADGTRSCGRSQIEAFGADGAWGRVSVAGGTRVSTRQNMEMSFGVKSCV